MKKEIAGVFGAMFVVGVVFAVPTSGKKEDPPKKVAAVISVSR